MIEQVAWYTVAGENHRKRTPWAGETFQISDGLQWIRHISSEGEETHRVNLEYVVEFAWMPGQKETPEQEEVPSAPESLSESITL
jgi:hypothetical protein